MTVINGIEIDVIDYKLNEMKYSILNNEPIAPKLHVIIVISNPCMYGKRFRLVNEFVRRMEYEEEHIELYIVELIYPRQKFTITNSSNPKHLQIHAETVLWHKENMINLGVRYLLPQNYQAFAWIDADIEFESATWALDTLKILNGTRDIVQLFSHCVDMDPDNNNLNIFNGFGYSFTKQKNYTTKGSDYWHPGYAWAITQKAYESIGGLYDKGILGSGDNIMAMSLIGKVNHLHNKEYHPDYNQSMIDFQLKARFLRLGYTPGVIRHHYHGTKENRKYTQRWQILMKHKFSPVTDLIYDSSGVLEATISESFKEDILRYFKERKEDN